MNIELIGHEARNAVLQIMQLFFDQRDEIDVFSSLSGLHASCDITIGDKKAHGEAQSESFERLSVMNTIKKSVFAAAKKLSDMPTPWGISTGIRPAKTARLMLENGKSESEIFEHLTNEYLVEEKKARLAIEVAASEIKTLSQTDEKSVGIYVGIPFCPSRCSYCSFISQATEHNKKYIEPYVEALIKEIRYTAKIVSRLGQRACAVYFGGGTPTAIEVEHLEKIIEAVKENFDLSYCKEFTVEAGRADTFSPKMLEMLKREGVDRISINPQSMHDETLVAVGRRHTLSQVVDAFKMAHEAGFTNINADLIAGLPNETPQMVAQSVETLLQLRPSSVTVHTLYMKRASYMIEDFGRLRFSQNVGEMVDTAASILKSNGFLPYYMYKQRNTLGNLENTAFALSGGESLYNVAIMEETVPIIALGAGGSTKAVGKEIQRFFNPKEASDYVARLDEVFRRKDEYAALYDDLFTTNL